MNPPSRLILSLLLALAASSAFAGTAFGRTLAVADAEHTLNSEWASYSCADRSRVKQVTSPSAQGKRAYDVSIRDGDDSYGERCEIGMGNPGRSGFPEFTQGDERWISWQVYLPDGYPIDTPYWQLFFQIHQRGDGGCPPISMGVEDGQFKMFKSARPTYVVDTREMWAAPATGNRWVKFTLHIKNSTNPNEGFVELFGDLDGQGVKTLLPRTATHTMTIDPNGGGAMINHARVGIYRNPAIRGNTHILFDGFTIATDRTSAEDVAFGGPSAGGSDQGGSGDGTADAPPKAKRKTRVWLRKRGSVRAAGANWPRLVRVYGGVRPGSRGARRSVMIQVRHNHRWEWLARSWVHRNGRFYIAANIDPAMTGRRVQLRAVVAGLGHSKTLSARI
ncbi:MAG: hypothetical protein QOJ57_599 [Thermoleophilaceae bacterium]|jgi:hypothetical protein|nr:hypothetical protein [Thermoleophilaceae bacterium]